MLQNSCLESPFWLLSQKVGRRRRSRRLVRTNRGCPCARPIILGWRVDNAFLEPSSWLPSVCRRRIGCLQKVRRRRWIGLLQYACLEPFWLPSVGRRRIGLLQNPCLEPTFWLPSVGRWWIGQLRLVRTNCSCPCARPIILGWRVDSALLGAPRGLFYRLLITSVLVGGLGSCPLIGGGTDGSGPCLFRKNLL